MATKSINKINLALLITENFKNKYLKMEEIGKCENCGSNFPVAAPCM